MLIPAPTPQEWAQLQIAGEYTCNPAKAHEHALNGQETAIPDVTAWPLDCPRPSFTVGGVYTFADVYGRQRTALVYTEQQARVDGSWWHVSELPADAVAVGTFTPDTALIADARRFVREVINSEQWS